MRFRAKWSSGSGAALLALVNACSSAQSQSSLEAGAGGAREGAAASHCEQMIAGSGGAGRAGLNCAGTSSGGAGITEGVPNSASGVAGVAGAGGFGQGGAAATGGSGAGAGGVAGASARGGNGTGGNLGKCDLLLLQASAALLGAQTCYTSSGKPFCTGYTTNECGCKVPVNDADSLETQTYVKAREAFTASCSAACSAPCVEPKGQTCQLILGLVVGSCVPL